MTFEKEAQRKSLINMMGRGLNPMEHARYMFSRKYRDVYDTIKDVDKEMRNEALGKEKDLRESIHKARMAYKNREYASVMYYSWKLQEDLNAIFSKVNDLDKVRERVMKEFYGEGSELSGEEKRQMHKALSKKPPVKTETPKAANLQYLLYAAAAPEVDSTSAMLKQAGPLQWLKENIPTARQMEGALFDRIFRNKLGKQREAARTALRIAENAFSSMKEVFNQLDASRTDFSAYITAAERFKNKLDQQTQELSTLYQSNFADLVPKEPENKDEGVGQPPALPATTEGPAADVPAATTTPLAPPAGASVMPDSTTSSTALVEPVAQEGQPPAVQPPQQAAATGQQLELDFEEAPPTLTSAEFQDWRNQNPQLTGAAALQVVSLWKNAETELLRGNKGVAAALLVKASEICDDYDAVNGAKSFLLTAEKVLKG